MTLAELQQRCFSLSDLTRPDNWVKRRLMDRDENAGDGWVVFDYTGAPPESIAAPLSVCVCPLTAFGIAHAPDCPERNGK